MYYFRVFIILIQFLLFLFSGETVIKFMTDGVLLKEMETVKSIIYYFIFPRLRWTSLLRSTVVLLLVLQVFLVPVEKIKYMILID